MSDQDKITDTYQQRIELQAGWHDPTGNRQGSGTRGDELPGWMDGSEQS
ncbi:MAG TPA: hypothetical protein VFZ97_18350 [Acidimicrobiales bacterium]